MKSVLHVENVTKTYANGVHALRGVSFDVAPGEVVGLLGPNGAGKTTLVEILTGFRQRDGGTATVLGLDPGNSADLRELRKRTGVVLQQTGHPRYLTVRETVAMHSRWYEHARTVDEALRLTGLEDLGKRFVRQLSGGQQRRLDVAVAIVGRPDMIFLDEPTTGFDPAARRHAWELVRSLRNLGTTVLLTTHYMEEATELADRVMVVTEGQIAGIGTADELAQQLGLHSVLEFSLPPETDPANVPDIVANARVSASSGIWRMSCANPTQIMAELCSWAVSQNIELQSLSLRSPSLEDTFLALTDNSDLGDSADAKPDDSEVLR